MRFNEPYPGFNPCKERPAPDHAEDVIRVAPEEYRKLVRDSVFARNFAELVAEEIRHIAERGYGSSDISSAMRVMLRLYDRELYKKAANSEPGNVGTIFTPSYILDRISSAEPSNGEIWRPEKPLSERMNDFMNERGMEVK